MTTRGIAHILTDMAKAEGQGPVTYAALATYRNRRKSRRPPDYFQSLWERFEEQAEMLGVGLAVLSRDGQHVLARPDSELVTIWIPPSAQWAIHECSFCHVRFIGQHNASRCPKCRGS